MFTQTKEKKRPVPTQKKTGAVEPAVGLKNRNEARAILHAEAEVDSKEKALMAAKEKGIQEEKKEKKSDSK